MDELKNTFIYAFAAYGAYIFSQNLWEVCRYIFKNPSRFMKQMDEIILNESSESSEEELEEEVESSDTGSRTEGSSINALLDELEDQGVLFDSEFIELNDSIPSPTSIKKRKIK